MQKRIDDRRREKEEENTFKSIAKKRTNAARRQGYMKGAIERAKKEGYQQGKAGKSGIGSSVLAGIAKMGEGTSFNTSNPVIFGEASGGKKKKKSSTGFSMDHMF